MTDLDRLEQLNRLRESGALTEGEFEQEKARILAGNEVVDTGSSRTLSRYLGVGLTCAAAIAALSLYGWTRSGGVNQSSAPSSPQLTVSEEVLGPSQPPQEDSGQSSAGPMLDFATSDDVIGLNPAYIEERLGVPREKGDNHLVFEVGGCTITYSVAESRVEGFYLDVSRSCRPKIRGVEVGPETTFGQLLQKESWGKFVAPCLTSCGNAADPVINLDYAGSRATRQIAISYSTDYRQARKAMEFWEKAVRADQGLNEFEAPFDYEPFSCVRNPPSEARQLLLRVAVRSVSVHSDQWGAC